MSDKHEMGLIGLAVMGQNLVMNMADHGFSVAVYNRTYAVTEQFLAGPAESFDNIFGFEKLEDFVASLKRPRKIMLMVKAGAVVDRVIEQLLPLLEEGDIIIDGGNSYYGDTNRRAAELKEKGILFVGSGVSGGEEGARRGPSLMPGGNKEAWEAVKPVFQIISAQAGDEPCCDWVGEDGAGHFVKMVHNGIEYGDMQLICEAYQLMGEGLGLSADKMAAIFGEWNKGDLDSYLVEITADILSYKEEGGPLVDKILDTAGQKGTGKWTGITALDKGVPLTLIAEAVYSRCVSALKDERVRASKVYEGPRKELGEGGEFNESFTEDFVAQVGKALLASKIISYAQGFMLMREAAREYGWDLNYGGIALMWRGGCIIRSTFLGKIREAYDKNAKLENLLLDDYFSDKISDCQDSWRKVVMKAVEWGIPVPAMSSALSFFDSYRSARLPSNLLQAQRDYFGAHTYERTDKPRGEFFHTNWTGKGGDVSSSTYNV
ncbi:MAG: decarboxylating NADP(+)-dependent phosphogluconate dehydrogenase [Spirochaetales bacterium]|nr:decarboxylating NADP(+)-dependent phosphogluconate dehydrogenase [Spirochaetales bacterium]